jgi:uncharacterized protein YdaU (DUF1376 family)
MHYYQFNIGDYYSHTHHLDEMEDLAYRKMIDYCYLNECCLPDSVDMIARKIGMRTHNESIANVLQEFFQLGEYGYFQPRIMRDIDKFKTKSEKAKASANARWSKKPEKPDANAFQTDSEGNANHKPLTNNHKPITSNKTTSRLPAEIFKYWCETMRKNPATAKLTPKREKAIKARLKEGYTTDQIKTAIHNCSLDPFSMGQNNRQKPFNDIELICRTGEKLESFLDGNVKQNNGKPDLDNQVYIDGDIPR